MKKEEAIFNYCLRLGDNALILGHRLSEWCSNAPILEEDIALTNISLDLIGRAQALLQYAGVTEGKNRSEDDLAYRRPEQLYFNNLVTELPNKDFAFTIARQLCFSCFEYYLYSDLCNSKDSTLAAIANKAVKEVKYHLEHAGDWAIRLGDGTDLSKLKMQKAINDVWQFTGELFEMDETDNLLLKEGIAADLVSIKSHWKKHVEKVINEATLQIPENAYMQSGGKKGVHTEYLGHILSEMQYLQRAYPDATW